jgi:N-methylhydantoinase A
VLGGRIHLDRAGASRAVRALAAHLGLDDAAMAAGIVHVVDARMADLVRRVTVERGHDPRALLLVAYGGAAGLHAAAYGFDAGATEVVLPVGAGVFSARGLADAERGRVCVRPGPLPAPLPGRAVRSIFAALERRARADLAGVDLELHREIDFRYRRQTHRLRVPVTADPLDRAALDAAVERFERDYERVYGAGTGYRAAGIDAVAFRLTVRAVRAAAAGSPAARTAAPVAKRRRRAGRPSSRRLVHYDRWIDTPIFDGAAARAGDTIDGPAIVEWPTTALLVPPGFAAWIDVDGHAHLVRAA